MYYQRQKKVEKPKQKDNWDKADIIAKFVSSIVLAGIGIYLTTTIQKAQIDFAQSNAQSEVKIKQATLTSQLIQHLTAADTNQRRIAIIALKGNLPEDEYHDIIKIVAVGDANKDVRITAIEQLGTSTDKTAIATLTNISLKQELPIDERKAALEASVKVSLNNTDNPTNWCFIGAGKMAFESSKIDGGFFTHNLLHLLDEYATTNQTLTVDDIYTQLQKTSIDSSLTSLFNGGTPANNETGLRPSNNTKVKGIREVQPVMTWGGAFDKETSIRPNNNTKYIIIGIDRYEETQNLQFSQKDAQRFKEMLVTRFHVSDKNIILIINPTRNILLSTLKSLSANADKNTSAVLYYAGISNLSKTEGLELISTDYSKTNSGIPLSEINSYFSNYRYLLTLWDAPTYDYH